MNENINLVEILKDAPRGTKLWSPICGECILVNINNNDSTYPITVRSHVGEDLTFTEEGYYRIVDGAECLIFPSKENRDWSTFKAPWNEVDPPEKNFAITVSCSLSKNTEVVSNNYDETGFNGAGSLNEPWVEYTDNEYTVEQIIEFAEQCAEYMLSKGDFKVKSKYGLKKMIDSCTGWNTDEENAEQV